MPDVAATVATVYAPIHDLVEFELLIIRRVDLLGEHLELLERRLRVERLVRVLPKYLWEILRHEPAKDEVSVRDRERAALPAFQRFPSADCADGHGG